MAAFNERDEGKTVIGSTHAHSGLGINTSSGTASFVSLVDSAGEEWFLWVDTTGDLRIGSAKPALPQADGTVVGGQS